MPGFAVRSHGFVELRETLARAGAQWPILAEKIAIETTEVMQAAAMAKVKEKPSTFRGVLLNGFTTQVITSGTSEDLRVLGSLSNEAVHAPVVDQGRRPGAKQPPVDAILPWVIAKIGDFAKYVRMSGAPKAGNGKAALRNQNAAAQARGMAFVVARGIKRKGIKGIFFFDHAAQAAVLAIDKIADRLIAEFVRKEFGGQS